MNPDARKHTYAAFEALTFAESKESNLERIRLENEAREHLKAALESLGDKYP